MKPMFSKAVAYSALLGLAAGAYPVAAHHSTTMFDRSKVIQLSGIVKELHWTNPHVAIFIDAATASEGVQTGLWVIELTSPGNLVRSGWTRNVVKPGDQVTADVAPLRDGTKGGALRKITLAATGLSYSYSLRDLERPNLEQDVQK
jgi:Family of unknown function (DUF6152)